MNHPGPRPLAGVAPQLSASQTVVRTLMTSPVVTVPPDMSVESAVVALLQHGISGAPVVDEHGQALGILTKTDLLRERYENGDSHTAIELPAGVVLEPGFHLAIEPSTAVREVMTPVVLTLPENAPVALAAALMADKGVHRVPITNDAKQVVGILSALDILRWLALHEGYSVGDGSGRADRRT